MPELFLRPKIQTKQFYDILRSNVSLLLHLPKRSTDELTVSSETGEKQNK